MHWYNLIHKKAYNPVTLSERASMKNGEEGYNSCRVMGAPDSIWEFAIDLECLVNFIIQIYERLYLNSLTNDNFIFTKKKMIILQMISHGFIGAALFSFIEQVVCIKKRSDRQRRWSSTWNPPSGWVITMKLWSYYCRSSYN